MRLAVPSLLIAGTHSGVGKTTVSWVLMSALQALGFRVQPFKIGPDFIDPGYHRVATGQDSINLDLWMMGQSGVRRSFARHANWADVACVEAMGALYDGEQGTRGRGSAANIARLLDLPVILVVDIWGMTRSTAAVLQGFAAFDSRVKIEGVILNRAGSRRHYEMVLAALPAGWRRKVLGYLPHREDLHVPERHLGLYTVEENPAVARLQQDSLAAVRETLDLERIVRRFRIVQRRQPAPDLTAPSPQVRLAVARDRAFCFYYAENLQMLRQAGAELVFFAPTEDKALPSNISGLYIGGGYPESFAAELAGNHSLHRHIRARARGGMPIYAECGGLMYLSRTLKNFDGSLVRMVGLLPLDIVMDRSFLAIRYVGIRTTVPSVLGPSGTAARGQEFHQSRPIQSPQRALPRCYQVTASTGEHFAEGYVHRMTLASYVHIHFCSNPAIPVHFVEQCRLHHNLLGANES